MDFKLLEFPNDNEVCKKVVSKLFDDCMSEDGSLNLSKSKIPSDICIDGMVLSYSSYFNPDDTRNKKLVHYLFNNQKSDGGFTWHLDSEISDSDTTICVLEGFAEFVKQDNYRKDEIILAEEKAIDYLIQNKLFLDNSSYRKLFYPYRYRYSILRTLEYFADKRIKNLDEVDEALIWLGNKKDTSGRWLLEGKYKGTVHFEVEDIGQQSRFITLAALKILKQYGYLDNENLN